MENVVTFHSLFISSWIPHHKSSCFPIQRVGRIRVQKKLRQKYFKNIYQIWNINPPMNPKIEITFFNYLKCIILVPNIGLHVWLITSKQTEPDLKCAKFYQTFFLLTPTKSFIDLCKCKSLHLIHIWVIHLIHETYGWRFIRISIRKFHPYFPHTTMVRTCHFITTQ